MQREHGPAVQPALLPVGTVVGLWRVVDWAGCGVYGAVFRAVHTGEEQARPVALKLALLPGDPRFPREVKLLARLDHPSIPRLLGHGEWQHPSGTLHPYIAMEWVDGVPLYDWAREQKPALPEVLRLLAQLAGALQAVHAEGGVHRDVKGANVLVRRADHHAWLLDFGTGTFQGAYTLTPPMGFPGTPAYRSPESWLFELQFSRSSTARYAAGPADDLYALGVTACRLVTGEYPELGEPTKDENGLWHLEKVIPPAALQLLERVEPQLRALILRMLSVRPEERGSAAELAEALELAAQSLAVESAQTSSAEEEQGPPAIAHEKVAAAETGAPRREVAEVYAAEPLEDSARTEVEVQVLGSPAPAGGLAKAMRLQKHVWLERHRLVAAAVVLGVLAWWVMPETSEERPSVARKEVAEAGKADAGPVGLGEVAASLPTVASPEAHVPEGLTEDTLPEPLPGQTRPNAKGRCPHKRQIALNGGCWVVEVEREKCEALSGRTFESMCYVPVIPPGHPPTSGGSSK
ncbi:serine/threonine-protein kinase [Hyalangium sp.]|uniref:serine/threonine protein kinase n=1 Tax=Hyalangium sp. TaxID=2028555 RepID=UPI002D5CE50B|nr:serine/threonine-protein kinase [Hyalangium sp.]HYH96597.1 serine/threonine-protein kinase [Hyalangium sp.]